jgi:hypothetical protein
MDSGLAAFAAPRNDDGLFPIQFVRQPSGKECAPSHFRDTICPSHARRITLETREGAGKAGRDERTRSLACGLKEAHELKSPQVRRCVTGLPCAMVYDLLRALLGVHDLLVTVACET